MKGKLEVIVGGMWAGKSEDLIRRLMRKQIAGKKVILLRPSLDTRYSVTELISHSGLSMKSFSIEPITEQIWANGQHFDVIGVDEIQFFDDREFPVLEMVDWFINKGKLLIVTGLDLDSQLQPFKFVPNLMAYADEVTKLKAVCIKCGQDAGLTQRLIPGGSQVLVGGSETYEARCRECHFIP